MVVFFLIWFSTYCDPSAEVLLLGARSNRSRDLASTLVASKTVTSGTGRQATCTGDQSNLQCDGPHWDYSLD